MLPPTLKVCGRTLLPFTLRHRVALETIKSPVLMNSDGMTIPDLLFAVRVLSTNDLNETRAPTTFREKVLGFWYAIRPEKAVAEALKLRIYFEAQSLWPRFWEKNERAKDSGIPWQLTIIANLVRNGLPIEQAWAMPESQAIWLYLANCKAEGAKLDLITDEEFEAMQREQASTEQKQPNTRN
jgi:hypothetical protein